MSENCQILTFQNSTFVYTSGLDLSPTGNVVPDSHECTTEQDPDHDTIGPDP